MKEEFIIFPYAKQPAVREFVARVFLSIIFCKLHDLLLENKSKLNKKWGHIGPKLCIIYLPLLKG
jgi:hypothetical protein